MSDLRERGKALEEKFFKDQEAKAVEALREQIKLKEAQNSLASHAGITDESIVSAMVKQGVDVEAFIAIRMIPLVLMSWASGKVEAAELEILHNHMFSLGIDKNSPVHSLVDGWVKSRPNADLEKAWTSFMSAYLSTLSSEEQASLKNEIITTSIDIAQSEGGFLGIGKVSSGESELLERLKSVF